MRDFAADWRRAIARAEFRCAQCGELAARVALLTDDWTPASTEESAGGLITQAVFYGEWAQVVSPDGMAPVAAAIAADDATALYALEPLWAPFYCPECERTYCHDHWHFEVVYDKEWPTWYDETIGTCPRGHRRCIDD